MHAVALAYFREVARSGSVRRAAGVLNVAASALNRQILKLEDEFGTPLFDRLPGGMRLTVAGQLLLRHVNDTLHEYDRVRSEIDDLKEARSGHVSIAALDSLLVDFLPRALDRFRIDFPAVAYTVTAHQPADIPRLVAEAPIGVIMRPDHPPATRLALTFDDVARYPIFTQPGPLPRAADADPEFAAFRASIRPRVESNSIQMLKLCVMLNMGIAFFTRLGFLHDIETGELTWRPFTSPGINRLRIGLLVPSSRSLSPPAQQLSRRLVDDLHRFASV